VKRVDEHGHGGHVGTHRGHGGARPSQARHCITVVPAPPWQGSRQRHSLGASANTRSPRNHAYVQTRRGRTEEATKTTLTRTNGCAVEGWFASDQPHLRGWPETAGVIRRRRRRRESPERRGDLWLGRGDVYEATRAVGPSPTGWSNLTSSAT
jgi:hypothetical protein